jgi:hypothetical protein
MKCKKEVNDDKKTRKIERKIMSARTGKEVGKKRRKKKN